MKQQSAEYFAWFKFLYVEGLNTAARRLIYKAICEKKITIEELFVITDFEFREIFSEFGTEDFPALSVQNFRATNTKKIQTKFEDLYEDTFFIPLVSPYYPRRIRQRLGPAAPPAFFGRGHLPLINVRHIAVIGSEAADEKEIKLTWRLCTHFARMGYDVLSNHSWGVSEHAHKSALVADGTTTGLIACGFNDFWVRTNIQKRGYEVNSLFISAVLPNKLFTKKTIQERAKLLVAWAEAVVVVKSDYFKDENTDAHGHIAAARYALENNIPIFIPHKKLVNRYSLGNAELSVAGAIEFTHPREITAFLYHRSKPA